MSDARKWSNEDVVFEMKSGSVLNKVRVLLTSSHGEIDQAEAQRRKPTIFDIRRMEFTAAQRIVGAVLGEAAGAKAEREACVAYIGRVSEEWEGPHSYVNILASTANEIANGLHLQPPATRQEACPQETSPPDREE